MTVHCHTVTTNDDLDEVRRLWEEFRAWLAVRYAGDDAWLIEAYFDEAAWQSELASLPGPYSPDRGGTLLLARLEDRAVGAVAMRAFDAGRCEMKRMFVSEAARGLGVGDALVRAVVRRGAAFGYETMVLDTGFRQHEAAVLYSRHGFVPSAPYDAIDPRMAAGGLRFMRTSLAAHRNG